MSIVHCPIKDVLFVALRGRNWSIVGYPDDSLPKNYREILCDELHLCFCESPVHDADLNGDGSEKKKHIHFVFTFEGNKSLEQIQEISDRLHSPNPMRIANLRSMVRYLIHADNPEKHQYQWSDIKSFGGFDVESHFTKSRAEYNQIVKDIIHFCKDNRITEFGVLCETLVDAGLDDWFEVLANRNSVFFSAYLKSLHFSERERIKDEKYEEYLGYLKKLSGEIKNC